MAISRTSYAERITAPDAPEILGPDDDLGRLEALLVGLATTLLWRKGRFFPFGGVVWADGGTTQLVAAPVERGVKEPEALLDALVSVLRAEASSGKIRAAGTCIDQRGGLVGLDGREASRAIRTELEDASGLAQVCLLPYERKFFRRLVILAGPLEEVSVPRLFDL